MMELLTGDVMISALADLLVWVIVFVVVYLICRAQRLKKDIIVNALEDTRKMEKSTKNMVDTINKGAADRSSVRKGLWKFKQKVKNTKSIVQVFLYENGDDADLNTVVSLLSSVNEETIEFAKAFNIQSKEDILSSLNKTNDDLSKIEMILSSVVKRREDEALARI